MTAADLVAAIAQATGASPNSAFEIFAEFLDTADSEDGRSGNMRKLEIQAVKRKAIDGTGTKPDVVVIEMVEIPE
jgi:hypothetical protein